MNSPKPLVLASSSPYRRQQLEQIAVSFTCVTPAIDETAQRNEQPEALALRLATSKAAKVLQQHPEAIVIGSDQVAELNGQILGKPHTFDNAFAQLSACSGACVQFFTAISVASAQQTFSEVVPTRVKFLPLKPETINSYLQREAPFDCAGSFKCEGLGIALFEAVTSDDPSALIGLPLIALNRLLTLHGYNLLAPID